MDARVICQHGYCPECCSSCLHNEISRLMAIPTARKYHVEVADWLDKREQRKGSLLLEHMEAWLEERTK